MSAGSGDLFEVTLADFKSGLTPRQLVDFQFATLNDVREEALRIQRDQENLKKMMNMARIESFLEAMDQFGKVIEVFANANVLVAFVWGPFKFILQTTCTFADTFESILDAYKQLGEHMPLLEQYKSLFGNNLHMRRVLTLIYSDILEFHKKAVHMFRGRTDIWRHLFRSIWKDFGTRFKGILQSLSLHRKLIVEQAEILHFEESQSNQRALLAHIQQYEEDGQQNIDRLKAQEKNESDRKYLAVLGWFAAALTTISDHENFRQTRLSCAVSGKWILKHEKVQNWREEDPPVSSILWINGIPGAGKTILASAIVDSCLEETSHIAAYFYCQEDDQQKNECIAIYKGLLSQLLAYCRELIPYCYDKVLSSGEGNLNSQQLAQKLLKLCFEMISKQFIIIDGLDECVPAERTSVLKFFTNMINSLDSREPGKLRVLFVSQDFPDIGKALRGAEVLKLTSEDNKNDIKSYVHQWSERISRKYSLGPEDTEFIEHTTMVRSQGMFLYAKLVMENLYAQETQMNLMQEIRSYSFPDGLGEAYQRILLRLKRSLLGPQWTIVCQLLGWMVCAKRPLKWREIQAAVSMDPNEQTFEFESKRLRSSVDEYCGSLIQVLSGDRVELVHTTAKIYIAKSGYIHPSTVECDLTARCLRYLTFECFDGGIDQAYLQLFTQRGFLSFQDYASAKWPQHIRALIKTPSQSFSSNQESIIALQEIERGLEEFFSRYEQEMFDNLIPREVEEDCEPFKDYPFYANLVHVWNHVYQHENSGPEARKQISIKSLHTVIIRNREVLEKLPHSEDKMTFYGDNHFKCPRPNCFYFSEGFRDAATRDHHINRHDRPFNCSIPDCSLVDIGFSSGKELEKHNKTYHPELTDQTNSYTVETTMNTKTAWACEICGKRFTRGFIQRDHLRSHAGEKPFKCGDCGRAFVRKNDCKRHEKLHTRGR